MNQNVTPAILQEILAHKREEIKERKRKHKVADLKEFASAQSPARDFAGKLIDANDAGITSIIAEIKRASPSQGILREDFDPLAIARAYANGGATCLSILTDNKFFQGAGTMLDVVRRHCWLPALRKDFIIDKYQIYESRAFGADCILLIVAALQDDGNLMTDLFEHAQEYDMDILVEAHNEAELERALELGDDLRLVGINNRDLHTFDVQLETSERLAPMVPKDKLIVCESGIADSNDIARMRAAGINTFLIGESLIRAPDPEAALKALLA